MYAAVAAYDAARLGREDRRSAYGMHHRRLHRQIAALSLGLACEARSRCGFGKNVFVRTCGHASAVPRRNRNKSQRHRWRAMPQSSLATEVWSKIRTWSDECVFCRINPPKCSSHSLCFDTATGIINLLLGEVGRPTDLKERALEDAVQEILAPAPQLRDSQHLLVNVQCKQHQFVVELGVDDAPRGSEVLGPDSYKSPWQHRRIRFWQSWNGYFNLAWWMGLQADMQWYSNNSKMADPRFQYFRDLQLTEGSLSYSDALELLRFLLGKSGPVWRIERHVLRWPLSQGHDHSGSNQVGGGQDYYEGMQWEQALALLCADVQASASCLGKRYDRVINELANAEKLERAVELLEDMKRMSLLAESYSVVMSAALGNCVPGGRWEEALQLLEIINQHDIPAESSMYTAALAACDEAGHLEQGPQLLEDAAAHGFGLEILSYSAAISACKRHEKFRPGLAQLYGDAYQFMFTVMSNPEMMEHMEKVIDEERTK
eukprot:TRINITY_DN88044_c0_g1_i1.p1 TRINITY_DN88044_c0_g1~~TRINITY_DN88044_c0_g1_i1.p1  ORF type:complete len:489 (-),score=82.17 TRINITY_DN88044_c0_g1_i1:140-1606(-)